MRDGLLPGLQAEVVRVVTEEMTAHFEELGPVHPLYSTWTMVRHMEEASRKVILPFLEPHEDAVGHSVTATHLSPTPVGGTVRVVATVERVEGRRIVCRVAAYNDSVKIGEGSTVQVVMTRDRLRDIISGAP